MALEACPAGQVTTNNLVVLCHTTLTPNALVALESKVNLEYLGLFGFELIELLNKKWMMIFASFHLLLNDDALVQHKHRYCMHKINVAGKMEKLLTRRCRRLHEMG